VLLSKGLSMINTKNRNKSKLQRIKRIRAKISGTATCPRLVVIKSNYALYAQLIDDVNAITLCSWKVQGKNMKAATDFGLLIAKNSLEKNIKRVVFDRRGYRYHGVVKEIADSARKGGLTI
jgi:large subunit ribosomal protein L18